MAPSTVLDIAANTGWFAQLAARRGARVIAADNDETCVNKLFAEVASSGLAVVPVVSDFFRPLSAPAPLACDRIPAEDRFRSELVLALAITHHMALAPPWLDFTEMTDLLAGYTAEYLFTEFISFERESNNPYVPSARPGCREWYTLRNFMRALGGRFREVVLVPGPAGRRLVLAKK